jgi:hypothetical protein
MQLPGLYPAELGERPVGGLIAPDALRRGEHRIAAIALFVFSVILVAVDDHLVADFPAGDLPADCPDDPGRVRAGNMEVALVTVER